MVSSPSAVVEIIQSAGRLAFRASNAWFIMMLFVINLCCLFNIVVVFNRIEHCKYNEQNLKR